jgi:hypothetical protein
MQPLLPLWTVALLSFSTGDLVDQLYCNNGRADLFHEVALELADHERRHTGLWTVAAHLFDPTTAHLSDLTTAAHLSDYSASLRQPQPLLR